MRTISPEMQRDLESTSKSIVVCVKVERKDGHVTGFTMHDEALTFDGTTFDPRNGMVPTKFEEVLGAEPDDMEIVGAFIDDQIKEDVIAERFDNANVTVYLVNWMNVSNRIIKTRGHLGYYSRGDRSFTIQYRGLSDVLNRKNGRIYSKLCPFNLYDGDCTVRKETHTFDATIVSPSSKKNFRLNIEDPNNLLSQREENLNNEGLESYFTQGLIEFLDGKNKGLRRTIKKSVGSSVLLFADIPFDPEDGAKVKVSAGCRKNHKTCNRKFYNVRNFGGFPFVPGDEKIFENATQCDSPMNEMQTMGQFRRIVEQGGGPDPDPTPPMDIDDRGSVDPRTGQDNRILDQIYIDTVYGDEPAIVDDRSLDQIAIDNYYGYELPIAGTNFTGRDRVTRMRDMMNMPVQLSRPATPSRNRPNLTTNPFALPPRPPQRVNPVSRDDPSIQPTTITPMTPGFTSDVTDAPPAELAPVRPQPAPVITRTTRNRPSRPESPGGGEGPDSSGISTPSSYGGFNPGVGWGGRF